MAANTATFDLTLGPRHGPISGLTRAERAAINGDALIKLKETIVNKKVLPTPLKSMETVTSFDSESLKERKDTSNFFNFVSTWREDIATFKRVFTQYYLDNVFKIVYKNDNGIPIPDAAGNDPTNPAWTPTYDPQIEGGADLLELWHTMTYDVVADSCLVYYRYAEDVDRQNLAWSAELLLNNMDSTLRSYLQSQIENLPEWSKTGPVIFFFMAKRIVTQNTQVSHNILGGITSMELRHFEGEDVVQATVLLRHVLRFLNHGVPGYDQTPPTIMQMILDVFERCSNSTFRAYVRQLRSFHQHLIPGPEDAFYLLATQYQHILTQPGSKWLPTKKSKGGAFTAKPDAKTSPSEKVYTQAEVTKMLEAAKLNAAESPSPNRSRPKYEVDRTPPKQGEPTSRVNEKTGREEHWCSKCPKGGRWGNHSADGHDKWLQDFQEYKKKQAAAKEQEKESSPANADPPQSPPSSSSSPSGTSSEGPASMKRASAASRQYVSFVDSDDKSF